MLELEIRVILGVYSILKSKKALRLYGKYYGQKKPTPYQKEKTRAVQALGSGFFSKKGGYY